VAPGGGVFPIVSGIRNLVSENSVKHGGKRERRQLLKPQVGGKKRLLLPTTTSKSSQSTALNKTLTGKLGPQRKITYKGTLST